MIPRFSSSRASLTARIAGLVLASGLLSACASRGTILAVAERHEGKTARQLGLPATLWCADAANLFRREAGLTPVKSRRAIDQAKHAKAISRPVPGALMISRRRGGHHVDVVAAVNGMWVEVIGGNVAGRVTRRHLPLAAGRFFLPS